MTGYIEKWCNTILTKSLKITLCNYIIIGNLIFRIRKKVFVSERRYITGCSYTFVRENLHWALLMWFSSVWSQVGMKFLSFNIVFWVKIWLTCAKGAVAYDRNSWRARQNIDENKTRMILYYNLSLIQKVIYIPTFFNLVSAVFNKLSIFLLASAFLVSADELTLQQLQWLPNWNKMFPYRRPKGQSDSAESENFKNCVRKAPLDSHIAIVCVTN